MDGLLASRNLGQIYDFTYACQLCGAGAVPVPPLLVDIQSVDRRVLGLTAHDGRLIVRKSLAEALTSRGVSGFNEWPVADVTKSSNVETLRWLEPTFEWPRLAAESTVAREDVCQDCGRAGHFDSISPPTRLRYAGAPRRASDIGATYEYFGVWRAPSVAVRPIGGGRLLIVSDRFRDALNETIGWRGSVEFEEIQVGAGDA
jgi:hypothetical protein